MPALPDDVTLLGDDPVSSDAIEGEPAVAGWLADEPGGSDGSGGSGGAGTDDHDTGTGRAGLLKSSVVVGLGTGLSRATGLIRVLALAYALDRSC